MEKGVSGSGSDSGRKSWVSILFLVLLPLGFLLWAGKVSMPKAAQTKPTASSKDFAHSAPAHCYAISTLNADPCTSLKTRATLKVPEPAPLLLVGTGLLSVAALIRKRITR